MPHPFTMWPVRGIALALALALMPAQKAHGEASSVPEYAVKAAFLLNIAKYGTWPSQAFADSSAPMVIGILGDDPFGGILDRVVSGRVINERRVVVRRSKRAGDLRGAHVVFVSASESERASGICASLAESGTLCVGDTESMSALTAICFSVEGGKVIFNVNLAAVRRSNVAISSKLLQLARNVTGRPVGERVRP